MAFCASEIICSIICPVLLCGSNGILLMLECLIDGFCLLHRTSYQSAVLAVLEIQIQVQLHNLCNQFLQ